MSEVPYVRVDGFPFNNVADASEVRMLLTTLEPRPESLDDIVALLDQALAYAARYQAVVALLSRCDESIGAFSPLAVERVREDAATQRHRYGRAFAEAGRPRLRAPRPNIFGPDDVASEKSAGSTADSMPITVDATSILADLAAARAVAEADVRAVRDGLQPHLHVTWLQALHDAAGMLVTAGKIRVSL